MPLVSILMSSYNHEKFISEAIESVLGQTFEDFELIIIDDGSKDGSQQIIRKYNKKDNRIKAIFHTKNLGIPKTYNESIENAKGKFISRIDSDDLWVQDKLEKQVEIMEQDENLVVWTEGEIIDVESLSTGKKFTQIYRSLKKSGNIFEELIGGNFIFNSSTIYKRKNLEGIKYDENLRYLNDHKFYLDLAYKFKYYFISEPLTKYRIHGENITSSNLGRWNRDYMLIGKYITQRYGDKLTSNENKKKIFNLVFTTPIYNSFKEDPWNKLNVIYLILLFLYAIKLIIFI